jgi:hypothetical protein
MKAHHPRSVKIPAQSLTGIAGLDEVSGGVIATLSRLQPVLHAVELGACAA